jgi:tetratricopeptide (TPR) repeat protein
LGIAAYFQLGFSDWGNNMRKLLFAFALSSTCLAVGLPQDAQAKTLEQRYSAALRILQREAASCRNGFAEARSLIATMQQDEELKKVTPAVSMSATLCAMRHEDYEAILEFGPDAEKIEQIGEGYDARELQTIFAGQGWQAAYVLERDAVALATFRRYAELADTTRLSQISANQWYVLLRFARTSPNPAVEHSFISSQLERSDYKGLTTIERSAIREQITFDRLKYAKTPTELAQLLPQINTPINALEILVDNRYAAARALPEARRLRDLMTIAQSDLVQTAQRATENPGLLEAQRNHATSLMLVNRPSEALAIIAAAQAKLQTSRRQFTDSDEQENWLLNDKAYALRQLGRIDEGISVMQAASRIKSEGGENISQTINLAIMQMGEGQYSNALSTLDLVGAGRSRYANSLINGVKYCAQVQVGRPPANGEEVIAELKALGSAGLTSTIATALCINNLDLAAETFLATLDDPDFRTAGLLAAQAYRQESSERTAYEIRQRARALIVLARPEVKAKLEQYGSPVIIPFPLRQFEF